jgi:hypothetical protein
MDIREAVPDDNDALQELQSKCPQGTDLIASVVNTPDFFARAKAYESYKVYIAYEGNHILGSTACGFKNAVVNGEVRRVGYGIFQNVFFMLLSQFICIFVSKGKLQHLVPSIPFQWMNFLLNSIPFGCKCD